MKKTEAIRSIIDTMTEYANEKFEEMRWLFEQYSLAEFSEEREKKDGT